MALEALEWQVNNFEHQPKHDLESLFYVILTICTYVASPGHLRSPIPAATDRSICPNEWWDTGDLTLLARNKAAQVSSLHKFILSRLPPYWDDFHQVLTDLRNTIWPNQIYVLDDTNVATHDKFLEVLTAARERFRKQEEVPYPFAVISNKESGSSGSQKRKGKNNDAVGEAKRSRKLTDTPPSQSDPIQSRTSQVRSTQDPPPTRLASTHFDGGGD